MRYRVTVVGLGLMGAVLLLVMAGLGFMRSSANSPANRSVPTPTRARADSKPLLPEIAPVAVSGQSSLQNPVLGAPAVLQDSSAVTTTTKSRTALLPAINGVPLNRVVVMPERTRQYMHVIFARGQSLGRNPRAISKVGDSTMIWPPFLAAFDNRSAYKLGVFDYLQPAIEHYAGSFARNSIAVVKGMHTWTEFDPTWANQSLCKTGEGPLACELRLHNPSVAIIRLGVNDAYMPAEFETQLRRIVELCIEAGVIPVVGSKPDRLEGSDNTINKIVYKVAAMYDIPLWDYDVIAETVPGKGLQEDGMHFINNGSLRDYTSSTTYKWADALEDLTGLIILDEIRRELGLSQTGK